MANFTLANNLASVAPEQDPFSGAAPLTDQQVMKHPFQDIQLGMQSIDPGMQQPTMSQVQKPIETTDFEQLAKQYNIDLKGLSKNRDIGGLQLMKRMQQVFGPGFQQNKAFDPLMRAWQSYSMPAQSQDVAAATRAERTLGAIMGL